MAKLKFLKKLSSVNIYLTQLYLAAGITFAFGICRDYLALNFFNNPTLFFETIYMAAICSGLSINAISFSSRRAGTKLLVVFLLVGLGISVSVPLLSQNYSASLVVVLIVVVCWIIGAYFSQEMMRNGMYFMGKAREGIASLIMCSVIFATQSVNFTIVVGVVLSTAIYGLYLSGIQRKFSTKQTDNNQTKNTIRILQLASIGNFTSMSSNLWALKYSMMGGEVFGVTIVAAIRFSSYAFQALSISGSYFIHSKNNIDRSKIQIIIWVTVPVLALFIISEISIALALVVAPVLLFVSFIASINLVKCLDRKA